MLTALSKGGGGFKGTCECIRIQRTCTDASMDAYASMSCSVYFHACIQRHSCTKEVCVNLQLGGGVRAWVHMCMCTVHLSSNNASGPESAQLASSSIRAGGD